MLDLTLLTLLAACLSNGGLYKLSSCYVLPWGLLQWCGTLSEQTGLQARSSSGVGVRLGLCVCEPAALGSRHYALMATAWGGIGNVLMGTFIGAVCACRQVDPVVNNLCRYCFVDEMDDGGDCIR